MPAMPHRLQNPKCPLQGPKKAKVVWKGVYPKDFRGSRQLSLDKFLDPTTFCMRNINSPYQPMLYCIAPNNKISNQLQG